MKPSEVPQEAVTAFCQAFWGVRSVELVPGLVDQARATLAAVLPEHERQVRERIVAEFEEVLAKYPTDIWPEPSTREDAPDRFAASAKRTAYRNAVRIARGGA